MSRPCEILGDVNANHRCLVDGDGCVFSALSPESASGGDAEFQSPVN